MSVLLPGLRNDNIDITKLLNGRAKLPAARARESDGRERRASRLYIHLESTNIYGNFVLAETPKCLLEVGLCCYGYANLRSPGVFVRRTYISSRTSDDLYWRLDERERARGVGDLVSRRLGLSADYPPAPSVSLHFRRWSVLANSARFPPFIFRHRFSWSRGFSILPPPPLPAKLINLWGWCLAAARW